MDEKTSKLELVVRSAIAGFIGPIVAVGVMSGINYLKHHNKEYEVDGNKVLEKANGIFSYSAVTLNLDGSIKLHTKWLFGNMKYYLDSGNDGRIDEIFISFGEHTDFNRNYFYRNLHIEDYLDLFQKAQTKNLKNNFNDLVYFELHQSKAQT